MTVTFAALFGLTCIAALCLIWHAQNRADNLEQRAADLADQLAETSCQLDDAQRQLVQVQTSNAYLVREAETLAIDLLHTERRAAYYESCFVARKSTLAGVRVLYGILDPQDKMRATHKEALP